MSTISNAVAARDNSPTAMIQQYKGDFALMLPSHVNADQWARVAIGAIRRDEKLMKAAQQSPATLMAALSTAARLGLEAGTEQYYLTPRKNKGRNEILGITGYQGLVELMYRAGAVSSVIAEVVYSGDEFDYQPGRDERPTHRIDWDAEERGDLRLVYAYAVMRDGATSKVIVLGKAGIESIKKSAQGADSAYSPWKTNPEAMWLKSAVRQLAKWVPTSAEYRKEQLRAVQEAHAEMDAKAAGPTIVEQFQTEPPAEGEHVDPLTGEVYDAEVIEEETPWVPDEATQV